jgi:pyruvate formate lyase activating enzyme
MDTLRQFLETENLAGELWEPLEGGRVRCFACSLECSIPEGSPGVCKVRLNRGGELLVPWGYVAGAQVEPVEKKPFFHVLPGVRAFSFGMLGCDMHCAYCMNWVVSQSIRDPAAVAEPFRVTPEQLTAQALRHGAAVAVSTYNEPLVTAEWSVEVFRAARRAGLLTAFVSNGNATARALEYIRPWVNLYKVDLKCFDEEGYRRLGGRLEPVLETIRRLHQMGFWLEVVTLLVPGFNDGEDELRAAAEFLAGVSPDIPWHLTAYHREYRMREPRNTTADDLARAAEVAREAGLRYVYAGNLAGRVGELEDTRCGGCGETLVRRQGYKTTECRVGPGGLCPSCSRPVPGIWAVG